MDNELDLELNKIELEQEEKLKVKERFAKISEKATLANRAKEEAEAKVKTETERSQSLERERDFFKNFNATSSKYQGASQYQDKIHDKVKLGYSTEDAIVSVLNAEGKLTQATRQEPARDVAGGSAPNQITDKEKPVEDMSRDEKLSALRDAEKRGDISMS